MIISGIFFDTPETIPKTGTGRWMWNRSGVLINKLAPENEIRALLEGQFIARKAHALDMGFIIGKITSKSHDIFYFPSLISSTFADENTKIIATGGASENKYILQVLSDVFNAPVYVQVENFFFIILSFNLFDYGLLSIN